VFGFVCLFLQALLLHSVELRHTWNCIKHPSFNSWSCNPAQGPKGLTCAALP